MGLVANIEMLFKEACLNYPVSKATIYVYIWLLIAALCDLGVKMYNEKVARYGQEFSSGWRL